MPLVMVGMMLSVASHLIAGALSIGLLTLHHIVAAAVYTFCFLLLLSLLVVIESVLLVRKYIDKDSGHVDLAALWRAVVKPSSIVVGSVVVYLVVLAISGNANLVEVYRTTSTVWYDKALWDLEEPLFRLVIASNALPVAFWEAIYYMMWVFVLLVVAALVKTEKVSSYMELAIAIVLAFYATTIIAMVFPVAGPEYYHPELFGYLDGSLSRELQEYLGRHQAGEVRQNGLLYGTMATPSLHVALTAMATWLVARHWPKALWAAIPWTILIWISTVVLAWHYAVDGLAGIAMGWVCIALAERIVRLSQGRWSAGEIRGPQLEHAPAAARDQMFEQQL
ncbi:phosphatase PAP2 family protein [Cupriavidus necator]|uniref:phosphatase PAP2 family protein n=1 Tax=Cupriavidus necator TaxID=106590 RepID=UPI0005B52D2D|nr:phosphatase PAP2 family protein [Cupriavidus necator]